MSARRISSIIAMLFIGAQLIACGDDDSQAVTDAGSMDAGSMDAANDADNNDSGGMDASLSPTDRLQGLWQGVCIPGADEDGGTVESTRQGFAFAGDQLVSRIERYLDPTCRTPVVRVEIGGTFSVGDPLDNLDGAYNLDINIDTLTAQLLDEDFEDLANGEHFLGFDDWTAGMPRDVLGVDVFGTGHAIENDDTIYQIFRVVGVRTGNIELPVLLFGDESNGGPVLSPSQRPTSLSQAPHAFVRAAQSN